MRKRLVVLVVSAILLTGMASAANYINEHAPGGGVVLRGISDNIDFDKLWDAMIKLPDPPCDEDWRHFCAIRMSMALNGEGTISVNRKTYSGAMCKHGHALRAEELANWLFSSSYLGNPSKFHDCVEAKKQIKNKRGIIFFKDCFQREGQSFEGRTGDHIDLWKEGITAGFDDPNCNSKQIWFWPLQSKRGNQGPCWGCAKSCTNCAESTYTELEGAPVSTSISNYNPMITGIGNMGYV